MKGCETEGQGKGQEQGHHTCCWVPGCRLAGTWDFHEHVHPPPLPAGLSPSASPPLQALFQLHPGYSQKVREPIASFYVVSNPQVAG